MRWRASLCVVVCGCELSGVAVCCGVLVVFVVFMCAGVDVGCEVVACCCVWVGVVCEVVCAALCALGGVYYMCVVVVGSCVCSCVCSRCVSCVYTWCVCVSCGCVQVVLLRCVRVVVVCSCVCSGVNLCCVPVLGVGVGV